jgi:hypothetical protein
MFVLEDLTAIAQALAFLDFVNKGGEAPPVGYAVGGLALAMTARAASIELSRLRTAAAKSPCDQLSITACAALVWSSSASSKSSAARRRRKSSCCHSATVSPSAERISMCSTPAPLS